MPKIYIYYAHLSNLTVRSFVRSSFMTRVADQDPDPVFKNSWIRIRIRFVLRGWIRIRSISDWFATLLMTTSMGRTHLQLVLLTFSVFPFLARSLVFSSKAALAHWWSRYHWSWLIQSIYITGMNKNTIFLINPVGEGWENGQIREKRQDDANQNIKRVPNQDLTPLRSV